MATLDDRSRRRSAAEVSRQSSAKYYGDRPFSTVRQNCQLEFNALSHWQPMKLPQDARHVLTTSATSGVYFHVRLYTGVARRVRVPPPLRAEKKNWGHNLQEKVISAPTGRARVKFLGHFLLGGGHLEYGSG